VEKVCPAAGAAGAIQAGVVGAAPVVVQAAGAAAGKDGQDENRVRGE